jgi:acyl-coenzyme A thioesterase PaaI-like protein
VSASPFYRLIAANFSLPFSASCEPVWSRRNGRLVGVVDIDVTNEAGQLLAIGRATYATAV